MSKLSRVVLAATALTLAVGLTGCGNGAGDPSSDASEFAGAMGQTYNPHPYYRCPTPSPSPTATTPTPTQSPC